MIMQNIRDLNENHLRVRGLTRARMTRTAGVLAGDVAGGELGEAWIRPAGTGSRRRGGSAGGGTEHAVALVLMVPMAKARGEGKGGCGLQGSR